MKSPRAKGYRGEREIADILNENGIMTKRVPLSGSAEGYEGDLEILIDTETLIGEVKRRKATFNKLYQWLRDRDILFVRDDRSGWLVIQSLEEWLKLVR